MKQIFRSYTFLIVMLLLFNSCNSRSKQIVGSNNFDSSTEDKNSFTEITIGNRIVGTVIKVHDGDTYDLLITDNQTIRIRMEGIDAPEGGMPYYKIAKNYLINMVSNKMIEIHITDIDKHNRYIAYSYLENGLELGSEMIKEGLAWHYKEFNNEEKLSNLEIRARNLNKGLWKNYPYVVPPWTVRKLKWRGYKIDSIHDAQKEHLKGNHSHGCPDKALCEIIFGQ